MKRVFCSVFLVSALAAGSSFGQVYVDASVGGGADDGTSWANAYVSLTNALFNTAAGDLWIAEGTYYTGPVGVPGDSNNTFTMKANVNLYGGFTSGMATLGERDWEANLSILDGQGTNFHVVTCSQTIIFDGLVVQNGTAGPYNNPGGATAGMMSGGGLRNGGSSTIRNCIFRNNTTWGHGALGGAMYLNGASYVDNCTFTNNHELQGAAWSKAGAIGISYSSPTITNCRFYGNTSGMAGGAIGITGNSATIVDCLFVTNSANSYGGGIGTRRHGTQDATISNCTFIGNYSGWGGGVGHYGDGSIVIDNCTFASNSSGGYGGAIAIGDDESPHNTTGIVRNCKFSGNAGGYGTVSFGLKQWDGVPGGTGTVENCEFYGNSAVSYGGGVYWGEVGTGTVAKCLFAGNYGNNRGGGFYLYSGRTTIEGCTVYGNYATDGSGILNGPAANGQANLAINNSIVWGNAGHSNIANYIAGPTIAYTAVGGGYSGIGGDTAMTDGGGLVAGDPLFALNVDTGTWTVNGQYSPIAGQTTLTRTGAGWTANAFEGMAVHPDVNEAATSLKYLQYLVASNDSDTIWAWGDCSALALNGDTYTINDFHVRSPEGRYTPGGWVTDGEGSPCVDAGDPSSAYGLEPWRNGGRVNLGAYGNTGEASKSFMNRGTLFMLQ